MTEHVRRTRRKRRVKRVRSQFTAFTPARIAICAAALVAGFAVGFAILTYGPHAYRNWRESNALKRASAMLAKEDFDGATRAAREALALHRDSIAALYVLAEASEKQNRPETVAWRAQIARLEPDNLDSQLNLASAALRFGQLDTARTALEKVTPAQRDRASYHVVAGWLARAQGNDADVEMHFAAALEKEPTNDLYQFNLAVLRIRSSAPEKREESRKVLERLKKIAAYRAGSLRALLSDAVQQNELQRADTLAQDLQMSQQVTFADDLLCLEFYRKLDEKKFAALLEKVKPIAARNPLDLALLMDWLHKNGLGAEVLKWMEKLPAEITTVPPPAIAIADAFVEAKNWSRLKRWTRSGSWDDSEYLRLAYQAYGSKQSRQSSSDAEFSSLWRSAERAASDRTDREVNLARLASKWNLPLEAEQLWLRVSKDAPLRREALDALFRIYRANNDLTNLYRIAQRLHESSPNEIGAAANYARLALLVDQNPAEGHRVAKETYDRAPNEVNAAMTYAFSLYGLGRTAEGVEIMKKLPPEGVHDPHAAVYAAVLLLDENQVAAAQEYIAAAQAGPIFPEEKKLLEEAVAKASAATANPTATPSPTPSPSSRS
ncbi:MAG TPA: tetratricopeptide repeat protein [Chthoniobacterales bacterium]|nr:tetratricopeptide repeat protein [Chthoniobacterales bacterium]